MIYHEPIKIIINILRLAKVVSNMVVQYYGFLNLIISDKNWLFILKFYLLLYYFFKIKRRFLIVFYLQINSKTK